MKVNEYISYEEIYQFLTNKDQITKINELAKNNPGYGIFLTVQKLSSPLINFNNEVEFTFSEAEKYLEDYFAGTMSVDDATRLANAIIASKTNFIKLLHKINENTIAVHKAGQSTLTPPVPNQEIRNKILSVSSYNKKLFNIRKLSYGLLASAAILLILFFIPLNFNEELSDLYNYDGSPPLTYTESTFRNSDMENLDDNPAYRKFDTKFKLGISEYLVRNYAAALEEWKGLDAELLLLQNEANHKSHYVDKYYLYKALSMIAMSLSDKYNLDKNHKEQLLQETLLIFKKLQTDSDAGKFYYALTLALTANFSEAQKVLTTIESTSGFYNKGLALLEQIRDK
jgi:hypothetical protein